MAVDDDKLMDRRGREAGTGPRFGDLMGPATKDRILRAADRAPSVYPGPVGELLRQELRSWPVFGRFLGSDLIVRVADEIVDGE